MSRRIALAAAVAVSLTMAVDGASRDVAGPEATVRKLVGQRFVVAMRGSTPSPSLLGRIRRGEVGGVILYGSNILGPVQLRGLTARLQAEARAGGCPALLVTTDQEGGGIRRLRWAGPTLSATALGSTSAETVRTAGRLAGRALRAAGVNVDLAPVADVPAAGSFMALDQRTFSSDPNVVGSLAAAFAGGLRDERVAATAKHFPGIGRARRNTDLRAVTITAGTAALTRDLAPFRTLIRQGVPLVMMSNASYTPYGEEPGAWSPRLQTLLRGELGFEGVTITDALDGAATTRGRSLSSATTLAAEAGVDLLLLTGSEASSAAAYERLVTLAQGGRIALPSLRRSYDRIVALKQAYG
jgi:beta-N-acetylhexosaminidase